MLMFLILQSLLAAIMAVVVIVKWFEQRSFDKWLLKMDNDKKPLNLSEDLVLGILDSPKTAYKKMKDFQKLSSTAKSDSN